MFSVLKLSELFKKLTTAGGRQQNICLFKRSWKLHHDFPILWEQLLLEIFQGVHFKFNHIESDVIYYNVLVTEYPRAPVHFPAPRC